MSAPTVYLDNAATTPVDPAVAAVVEETMVAAFGNPSSRHARGLEAERHLRRARAVLARQLGVAAEQLVFTSGATEALALALLGSARQQRRPGHVVVSAVEHPAVLQTAALLAREGHAVTEVEVGRDGRVDLARLAAALRPETFLVAVMQVNNETGVIQPIDEVAALVAPRRPRCRLLVDAVQSFGLFDTSLDALAADIVVASAHKLHGPKGIGCLGVSKGVRLNPLWGGGDQELGRRPGTENVPGAVGFASAVERGRGDPDDLRRATERLARAVLERVPGSYVIGDAHRAPQIVAVALPGRRSEVVVNALGERGVFVSSGSACHSRRKLRSHVLEALRIPAEHGVIRISASRLNGAEEIDRAVATIADTL